MKLPGPLVQAPFPALPMNPQAKNMTLPDDMFVITKPGAGDRVPQGQLVITATPPKVGVTNVTELELRYLDAPPAQRDSYPYVTVFSVDTTKLLQGYPVAPIVTGGYGGRWQVRARSSMKAVPGPWSFPVPFQLIVTQPMQSQKPYSPIQQTSPWPSSSVTQPSAIPQTAPLPSSSVMKTPAPSGSAPAQMRRSPAMIMPRGVAAPPAVDPCKVVTTAEVEQAIGRLKGAPNANKEGAAAWCIYQFAHGTNAMEVWVFLADAIERARKKAKKPVAVKGLGDDAFMDRGAFGLDYVDLYIKKGDVTVKLSLQETAGDEEKLKALGQKAVGRF